LIYFYDGQEYTKIDGLTALGVSIGPEGVLWAISDTLVTAAAD
jgi:hypothetical protein